MADIKTHLRELSVAVKVGCELENKPLDHASITPKDFYNLADKIIANDINSAENIFEVSKFDDEYIQILKNGFKLGEEILNNFKINKNEKIYWYGNDTQKDDPIDLQIGEYGFSLKESSFILENMGLYKFLTTMTDTNFKRGLHVFEYFSKSQYDDWFEYTIQEMVKQKTWTKSYPKYKSSFVVKGNDIILNFNNDKICTVPYNNLTYSKYMESTNTQTREKVVAKWISENLSDNEDYIKLKKDCAEVAGANMCNFIKEKLDPTNLKRILQIREKEYYYAKSTSTELTILKVPSAVDFTKEIIVESIEYSVPKSQLNIVTTFKNTTTNQTLQIRNECRFSHGQFNGTPEAKMYYERKGDLTTIYSKI